MKRQEALAEAREEVHYLRDLCHQRKRMGISTHGQRRRLNAARRRVWNRIIAAKALRAAADRAAEDEERQRQNSENDSDAERREVRWYENRGAAE